MRLRKAVNKCLLSFIVVMVFCTVIPTPFSLKVDATLDDFEVHVGSARIGNATYTEENMFVNFRGGSEPGFTHTKNYDDANYIIDWSKGNIIHKDTSEDNPNSNTSTFQIKVADNYLLKEVAQSGTTAVFFGWDNLIYEDGIGWDATTEMTIKIDGKTVLHDKSEESDEDTGTGRKSGSATINENTVITLICKTADADDGVGVRGLYVKFSDINRPFMDGYIFSGNGVQRINPTTNQRELFLKQSNWISINYDFTERVKPTNLSQQNIGSFISHPLYVNPTGDGLPAAGQQQYLINTSYSNHQLTYVKYVGYYYSASKFDHSGNNPLNPKIVGTSNESNAIDDTLEQKFKDAAFADAAGNIAYINFPGEALGNNHFKGKRLNPFDYENGGYRVIIDAVSPRYTKTGNGIQPEILTGVTLNQNDTIDFTVQFTEEVIIKDDWDVTKTYLLFNNGMKAYYASGENTNKWTFTLKLTDEKEIVEVPLLKAIALTHDNKGTDKKVIQDYAGNFLIEPANYDGDFDDCIFYECDTSTVNSKIDWANLSIDNTEPVIDYVYKEGGATGQLYKKTGSVTVEAKDPLIQVPSLDPVDPLTYKESRGIYRPSNKTTGPSDPEGGLIYYTWSKSSDNPFADPNDVTNKAKGLDHFAAIKRYSLTGLQPKVELYKDQDQFKDINISGANNNYESITPPEEAHESDNSGKWYIHTWTADMTWDSARELMQYEKCEGSPEEKKSCAKEAVNYEVWPLDDFKQNDSNWVYNRAEILLDNKKPSVSFTKIEGDNSDNVVVTVEVDDEHSGMDKAEYQWVNEGDLPTDIGWKTVFSSSTDTTSPFKVETLNDDNVDEDGEYELYIRAFDQAGNETETKKDQPVIVNTKVNIEYEFDPIPDPKYTTSHEVNFKIIEGITPANVGYAYSQSTSLPSSFTEITPSDNIYTIPANSNLNGEQHLHIKVTDASNKDYYFTQTYYFDNTGPVISFSSNGVAFGKEAHEVSISIDGSSVTNLGCNGNEAATEADTQQYQWVKEDSDGQFTLKENKWKKLDETKKVCINHESLAEGEDVAEFKLFASAVDEIGNESKVSTTGTFEVLQQLEGDTSPPADSEFNLIYVSGDEIGGYSAIVELTLNTADKRGYEYSISPDNGVSWKKWRPYTNYAAIKVPSNKKEDLQKIKLKLRTGAGVISAEEREVSLFVPTPLPDIEPMYGLVTFSTTNPVNATTGVNIDITTPLGIVVKPATANPTEPVRLPTSNTFNVKENGSYSFELSHIDNPTVTSTLFVVVGNIDSKSPVGDIEYLMTAPTSGNVSVKLISNEPVRVTNNDGRSTYTFTENGTFTFQFTDMAGNTGVATATVTNIDKQGPKVKLVRSYEGVNNREDFKTIKDGNGNVLYSSGLTLAVEREVGETEEYKVMGSGTKTILENGTVTFVVTDMVGNTTVLEEAIDNIISTTPEPANIEYTFVDEAGLPLPQEEIVEIDGQQYAKGQMLVTLSGTVEAPNMVFSGGVPVKDTNGVYVNKISDNQGFYTYSRTFKTNGSTVIAITDLLSNVNRVPVTVKGLDNKPPEIKLNKEVVGVTQNKSDFDFRVDLGGFTATDNVSEAGNITVSLSGLELSKIGYQRVKYTASDQVGNETSVYQDVYVVSNEGMLIFANDTLISSTSGLIALFDRNKLTFNVSRYNIMKVNDVNRVNEWGTYDLLYYSGLYREGQMKYIAKKISYDELVNGDFDVTFPKVGWYTIIVRNQEREREYATFFIGEMQE